MSFVAIARPGGCDPAGTQSEAVQASPVLAHSSVPLDFVRHVPAAPCSMKASVWDGAIWACGTSPLPSYQRGRLAESCGNGSEEQTLQSDGSGF